MPETPNGFRNEFFFLSNFYVSPITAVFFSKVYRFNTGEHLFHAFKALYAEWDDETVRKWLDSLESAETPNVAKRLGRSIKINPELWDANSYQHMKATVDSKFDQSSELKEKLIRTGDLTLVEYNSWGDRLWGVDERTKQGRNQLGQILMAKRASLVEADTLTKLF